MKGSVLIAGVYATFFSVAVAYDSSARPGRFARGTTAVPSHCTQIGHLKQILFPKTGPYDRYETACGINFHDNTPPIGIANVASYMHCLNNCVGSPDVVAFNYRPSDGYCWCHYDYSNWDYNQTDYEGGFKLPTTNTACNYLPDSVGRMTAANNARFQVYYRSTFGASGGQSVIASSKAVDAADCMNMCANNGACAFWTFGSPDKMCYRYNNNGGAGLCAAPSSVETCGVRTAN